MLGPETAVPLTVILFVFGLLFAALKVLREYERGVVFFLGRFQRVKGPGLIIVIPIVQQMVRADLRTVVADIVSRLWSVNTRPANWPADPVPIQHKV